MLSRCVSLRETLSHERTASSQVMLQMGLSLGWPTRWVVDWDDHQWVELRMSEGGEDRGGKKGGGKGGGKGSGSRWVHVDPCEAAIDQTGLYASWGKNQTYIIALDGARATDVTREYTADWNATLSRRKIAPDQLDRAMRRCSSRLGPAWRWRIDRGWGRKAKEAPPPSS